MNLAKILDPKKMFHGLLLLLLLSPGLALLGCSIPLTFLGSNLLGHALVLFMVLLLAKPLIALFMVVAKLIVEVPEELKFNKVEEFNHGVLAYIVVATIVASAKLLLVVLLAAPSLLLETLLFLLALVLPSLFLLSCLSSPELGK